MIILHTQSSQSLELVVCQQLSCGYRCFMGSHINIQFSALLQCILYNLLHHYDALLLDASNAL